MSHDSARIVEFTSKCIHVIVVTSLLMTGHKFPDKHIILQDCKQQIHFFRMSDPRETNLKINTENSYVLLLEVISNDCVLDTLCKETLRNKYARGKDHCGNLDTTCPGMG